MPVVHRWKINRDIKIAIRIKAFNEKLEKIEDTEKKDYLLEKKICIEKILKMYEPLVKKLHKVHNK